MTVTHEQLHEDIQNLRGDVAQIRQDAAKRDEAIALINQRLYAGGENFAELKAMVAIGNADLKVLSAEVKALRSEADQRAGRDGVLAAIWRSPFMAWLAAAVAAVAAFVSGGLKG